MNRHQLKGWLLAAACSCITTASFAALAPKPVNPIQSISLAGWWHSDLGECKLPGTTDENHLSDGIHPTDVTAQLTRLWPFTGQVNYTREIDIPASMAGKPLCLYLERTKPTTLWVDGDSIGSQGHLYAAHQYTIPALKAGRHQLRIRVDNRNEAVPSGVHGSHAWSDATQTNWNGILGQMTLGIQESDRIGRIQVVPDVRNHRAEVVLYVYSSRKQNATYLLTAGDRKMQKSVQLKAGENAVKMTLDMGTDARLWSEFHPYLYTLTAQWENKPASCQTTFGMRDFGSEGTQFTINGKKTFLRGTHDGCVFPLTAYCPTDTATWGQLYRTAKQYGINHFRFHSYTPTEAAFQAADKEGIYLQVELPMWGTLDKTTTEINEYLLREAEMLMQQFGNHPSLMALGIGNELWGDHEMMAEWLAGLRQRYPNHLFTFGANNTLGWEGVHPGEDFMVTCRIGGGEGYTTQTRTSFSFADADEGGILNNTHPNTRADFAQAIQPCPVPVVSHETCQFQVYPDYREIDKYTGVLYPYNLEIFRQRVVDNHMGNQIEAFHQANGRFAVACDKADIEYCLRTPGFGGYQMLDIKDYPGQGSALCGFLDAFGDSKGLVTPEEFRRFCSPVVPLALMDKYCWTASEPFVADIRVSNFLEDDYEDELTCTLTGKGFSRKQSFRFRTPQGGLSDMQRFQCDLSGIKEPVQLTLTLKTGKGENTYNVWVYPEKQVEMNICRDLNAALQALERGETVILQADSTLIGGQSVGGLFTPDYWNYAMFKSISENNKKPVSPGTLGLLMDEHHPAFAAFPTEGRSDWQWWPIARFSRPLILDPLHAGYRPLVQVIDNVERNHRLGILMEWRVGQGKLLLTTTDLDTASQWPEVRAYRNALVEYARSAQFEPKSPITPAQLTGLLTGTVQERDIQGVKNLTDYKAKP